MFDRRSVPEFFDTKPHTATAKQTQAIRAMSQALKKAPVPALEGLSQAGAAMFLQDLTAEYRRVTSKEV